MMPVDGGGAEFSGGRVRLVPGDCEGIKAQEFFFWGPSLETPSLNCFCVTAP